VISGRGANILHVTTFLQGGAGRIIADLACAQHRAGHTVAVVTSKTGENGYCNYPRWIENLKSTGVSLLQVDSTFKRDVSLNIAAFKAIRDAMDWNNLTIVHSHAAIPSLISLLLASRARRRIPVLQTMHGWGITKSASQAATDITIMNALDRVVAVSAASQRRLVGLGIDSSLLTLVPYGVEAARSGNPEMIPEPLCKWKKMELRVIVCIGSVGPRKNQKLLLDAMSSSRSPCNIACAFIGEGDEIETLKAQVASAGLSERICFLGYQKETAHYLCNADWLILPSRDEGLPISILEAYRTGVPVLGSDIDEISEVVIDGKTGLLFQSEDIESLGEMLNRVSTMDEEQRLAMGEAGRCLWRERYTPRIMEDGYERVYRQLLSKQ
jgi:L-malate glycosyltransferase